MRTKKFIQIAAVGLLVLAGCAKKEIGIDHAESAQTGLTDSQTILTGIQDVEIYYMEPAMTIDQDESTGEDYFDFAWDAEMVEEQIGQFAGDYDTDGKNEICLLMTGASGTGVSVERLFMIEQDTDGKNMKALEFGGNNLWESIKQKLTAQWDANAQQLIVQAAGSDKKVTYSLAGEHVTALGIDCLNQIHFEVQDNKIWMDIDIGLGTGEGGPARFLPDEEGNMRFEVLYTGSGFRLADPDVTDVEKTITSTLYSSKTQQSDWTLLEFEELGDIDSSNREMTFLIAQEISPEVPVYNAGVNNTTLCLDFLKNLQAREAEKRTTSAEYYLLLRDENDRAICLIEVWDNFIAINHGCLYEMKNNEFSIMVRDLIYECEELGKIPVEEILLACTNDYSYGEFNKEDIVLYNEQPAILVENGYERNHSEEECYYEVFIYYNGLYFDKDYQTSYLFSKCKIYYYEDGNIQDTYTDRLTYYNYLTGEKMRFMY